MAIQFIVLQQEVGLAGSCIATQQIVLQRCSRLENCIAIHFLYRNLVGLKLCCNTRDSIAIE